MYNPDAHSDCMKQMGRRDPNEPVGPIPPHKYGTLVCPACLKHEDDCWGGACECECNNPRLTLTKLGIAVLVGIAMIYVFLAMVFSL